MRGLKTLRPVLLILLVVGGAALAMVAAARIVGADAMRAEKAQLAGQLDLYAQALQQRIDRYRTLPQVLALDPELHGALSANLDQAQRDALNRKLERANSVTRSSTLTLIGRDGIAVAASNWRLPSSNVGLDYSFRPYVQEALRAGEGRFYGIGITTGEPGYFLSQAIHAADGGTLGVIVIKIELAALEREWLRTPDIVLVSDSHGVVFLASRDGWRYRTLQPLSADDRRELQRTRQYAGQALSPLPVADLPRPLLWETATLDGGRWHLHLLHDAGAVAAASRGAAFAAGGAWLALSFLVLFVQQRRRLSAYRERSRAELETVLRQHAEELRTAQDGIVRAAQQADSGLSRSLEHLPQGVVIIDAALRLVAWNSRYVELFRFPPELMRVGRPVEDLFRHNARRGLLGGSAPVEEAIRRRLDHLRSGKPHLRESEKDDGTVLEIRGNPLPEGGFVTSYADITSYKNAARELRSLADALEHRIEERTRDLEAATRAAEDANRYKTRFVASAVHDLLQPLNAARMFLSALRGKLADDESRAAAAHADNALAAQDAILNSLLDIARLEAGSLQVRVRDFRLEPLLAALGREFGMAASSRGLRLEHVPADVVVRSDDALLRRILQNFLSNAVRYTRSGRILLGCRRRDGAVEIQVHDQGPGIPESLQQEIFEEFRRLDDGVANDRGAGLGLATVERIGRLLGHSIGLRSRLGRGSVFSVTVPFGDPAAADHDAAATVATEPPAESSLRGCRVWCIDADPQARETTRALLQRWGCDVGLAAGAGEALATAQPGNAPQLLLLDLPLDGAEGGALYRRLCGLWRAEPAVVPLAAPVRPPALRARMTRLLLTRALPAPMP